MGCHLTKELVAKHDFIFETAGQQSLVWITRVPDPRFSHEIETRLVRHGRPLPLRIGSEKDSCAKDSLKSSDQAAILRPPLLHTESVQHLGRAPEGDGLLLLSHGKCR